MHDHYDFLCLLGDSAGGNLVTGITMKCIKLGVRIPTGIFLIYAPSLIQFIPSPSRLLCLMDPLLPFGVLMKCLKGELQTVGMFQYGFNRHMIIKVASLVTGNGSVMVVISHS